MAKQSGYPGSSLSQGMAPSFCQDLPLLIYELDQGASAPPRATFVINNNPKMLHQTTTLTPQESPNSNAALLLFSVQPVGAVPEHWVWHLVQRCPFQLLGVEKMKTFYTNL